MKDKRLERATNSLKSDVDSVISELVYKIEELEEDIEKKDSEIDSLLDKNNILDERVEDLEYQLELWKNKCQDLEKE